MMIAKNLFTKEQNLLIKDAIISIGILTILKKLLIPTISSILTNNKTEKDEEKEEKEDEGKDSGQFYHNNITELIGNTPLIRIKCLSDLTGWDILGKCEFLNPGGSVKDRVALKIIRSAEEKGLIARNTNPPCKIFEGTSGSTGISLAYISRALGYEAEIVLPDDTSIDKSELISKMGAKVVKVRPVGIANKSHYVNVARERSKEFEKQLDEQKKLEREYKQSCNDNYDDDRKRLGGRSLFVNQFENPLNFLTHYESTGPEIWNQTRGKIFGFVSGVGTGGTISGVGKFLKERNPKVKIIVADPPGSGVFNKVKEGVMFSETEVEGKRRRHQMDTVVEGIGLNRMTLNLSQSINLIDDAIRVTDQETITMSRYIVEKEGLFLGSSSIVNLIGSLKFCKNLNKNKKDFRDGINLVEREEENENENKKKKKVIVCILCDNGQRNLNKFWNDQFLIQKGFRVDHHLDPNFNPLDYF